jgi:hypothetical protein
MSGEQAFGYRVLTQAQDGSEIRTNADGTINAARSLANEAVGTVRRYTFL